MIVALKIMLAIIAIACIYLSFFTIKQYKLWSGSAEEEISSVFEKILVSTMMFSILILLSSISILSVITILSELTIKLPF